jgi:hypothetical protein
VWHEPLGISTSSSSSSRTVSRFPHTMVFILAIRGSYFEAECQPDQLSNI